MHQEIRTQHAILERMAMHFHLDIITAAACFLDMLKVAKLRRKQQMTHASELFLSSPEPQASLESPSSLSTIYSSSYLLQMFNCCMLHFSLSFVLSVSCVWRRFSFWHLSQCHYATTELIQWSIGKSISLNVLDLLYCPCLPPPCQRIVLFVSIEMGSSQASFAVRSHNIGCLSEITMM